jgi:hypothetical protein
MPTECSAEFFEFAPVKGRTVVAGFDGGAITSDAGAVLLGATDRAIGLVKRFAQCFIDRRRPELVEHFVPTLVGQRVFGIALGYEDVNDHDDLRHDPIMAVLAGKLAARREDCAPVAGKSTLNRLELSRWTATRYHKIAHDAVAIEGLFVTLFLEAHKTPPKEIILDLDATDDPLHGHQEGRFFHGYYDCYCYLPLYIFCGRHLLAAKLRPANIDGSAGAVEETARIVAQIRGRWPMTRIILRADSGFARDALMTWCEANGIDFIFGLAKNVRLNRAIGAELVEAREESRNNRPSGAPLQGAHLVDPQELEPRAARHRQGGVDARRSKPALHRHLADGCRWRWPPSLRRRLLRTRRDGEPHQRVSDGPVRRPHVHRNHDGQSTPAVVCLDGLRSGP